MSVDSDQSPSTGPSGKPSSASQSSNLPKKTPQVALNEKIRHRLRLLRDRLVPLQVPALLLGVATTILQHGVPENGVVWEIGLLTVLAMVVRAAATAADWYLCADRFRYFNANRRASIFTALWFCGAAILLLLGPVLPVWHTAGRLAAVVAWSELFLLLAATSRVLFYMLRASRSGSPALMFVLSFVALILIGTGLLMLPGSHTARAADGSIFQQLRIALFTATSASCVTGLAVVPTGGEAAYWSRFGQVVIMVLFQIGGLGMMTISTIFALLIGQRLAFRESVAVTEVTEAMTVRDVRQLLLAILGFTLTCEVVGAILLSSLWSDLPLGERLFLGAFHSISAFCNAGFALTENSFTGMATQWQIWAVVCPLIIVGGFGFGTMMSVVKAVYYSIREEREAGSLFRKRRLSERLPLSVRVIVTTSMILLIGGMLAYGILEVAGSESESPIGTRVADAWFQSVTFRTAGFNTVDHGSLEPATKLFAVGLMFIGASPGSTGGGVKTAALAIIVLSLLSILNGRRQTECRGRTIPDDQVRYAFVIVAMGLACTMLTTLLLTIFERDNFEFLNILFEATSAFATVGVSTGITADLSVPSQLVIVLTMFVGRVGPLTVLMALTRGDGKAMYQYPEERVVLG